MGAAKHLAQAPENQRFTAAAQRYLNDLRSPWKLQLYFLHNLPSALWWGLRVRQASIERAEVVIPYNWRTKNPFRSIYFAALAGAGELSTGILANLARITHGDISMLVLEQRAEFLKKATGEIAFVCEDGPKAFEAAKLAVHSQQPQTVTMLGLGLNDRREVVSKIYITWTFKLRSSPQR